MFLLLHLYTVFPLTPLICRTQEYPSLNLGVRSHWYNCDEIEDRQTCVILSTQSKTSYSYLSPKVPIHFYPLVTSVCNLLLPLFFSAPTLKAHLCKYGDTLSLFPSRLLFPNGHLSDLVTKPLDFCVSHILLYLKYEPELQFLNGVEPSLPSCRQNKFACFPKG